LEAFENGVAARSLDEVIAADGEARQLAREAVRTRARRTA
jgi:hypothetical protein